MCFMFHQLQAWPARGAGDAAVDKTEATPFTELRSTRGKEQQ